ncbi:MAG: response regulator [Prevotella sp.]
MSEYNILIVDDHPIVREGLKVILSRIDGVNCTSCDSVEQLVNMLSRNICHDLYILDLEFPKADVFPIIGKINEQYPNARILVYSMHEDPWMLSLIDTYKIHGYVSKNDSMDTLLGAVIRIRDGGEAFSDAYLKARNTVGDMSVAENVVITEREKHVLYYLSKGYTTQEIAEKLHISYFTAKTHRNNLAKKLHAKNAIEIVIKGKKYL